MNPANTRILVIDDEEPIRLLISRHLQREGYEVVAVASGAEGLAYLDHQFVNVLFLDLIMPGLSGYEVLAHLQADPTLASISVIIVSAIDDLTDVIRCLDLGADDYILKPINPLLLNIRLHTCLERQWLRQQERAYLQQLRRERDIADTANRARSAFLANMSHELRTPLNAVIGYTEMLQEELSAEGETAYLTDLKKIRDSSRHLLSLINDILDMAKLESGTMELDLQSVDLAAFLDQVEAEVRSLHPFSSNTLSFENQAPPSTQLHTDEGKLRQILVNLLSNGLKFTTQGTVRLQAGVESRPPEAASLEADWITFTVSDTGIGIPLEQQERIFEAFTQVDDSFTRSYGGTGLGLAICYRLSQILGGTLQMDSEVNQGTTVTLHMPMQITPEAAIAPLDVNPFGGTLIPPYQRQSGLVLVVEGDRAIRDWMVRHLNQSGTRVITSWGGQDGLRLARDLHPALILLGITLPDCSLEAMLTALRTDSHLMGIPVILHDLTVKNSTESPALHGLILGPGHLLIQPTHYSHMLTLLDPLKTPASRDEVLLVQPTATTQGMLKRLLGSHHWAVAIVDSLDEAIARLDIHPPTALVIHLDPVPIPPPPEWIELHRRSPTLPKIYVWTRDGSGAVSSLSAAADLFRPLQTNLTQFPTVADSNADSNAHPLSQQLHQILRRYCSESLP
jgi:signal transduction histidine kinase